MQKIFTLSVLLFLIAFAKAQKPPPPPPPGSGFDSLKKGFNNVKLLFKKPGELTVTLNGIADSDTNFLSFKKDIESIHGVKKVSVNNSVNIVSLDVLYKGKATDLWQSVSQNEKQKFNLIQSNDTLLALNYASPIVSAQHINASNQQQSKTDVNENNQPSALSKGAALLFKNIKTKISDAEKNKVFDSLGFKLSKDAKQFILDAESADYPFDAFVYPTDLNKDGIEEIFIAFGNTYTSGNTGSSIVVFIADKKAVYRMNLGFPGTLPDALATSNLGYPDLLIGGPGMEFPVWRWNGKAYDYFKSVKDSDYDKLKKTSVEDLSKTLQLQ